MMKAASFFLAQYDRGTSISQRVSRGEARHHVKSLRKNFKQHRESGKAIDSRSVAVCVNGIDHTQWPTEMPGQIIRCSYSFAPGLPDAMYRDAPCVPVEKCHGETPLEDMEVLDGTSVEVRKDLVWFLRNYGRNKKSHRKNSTRFQGEADRIQHLPVILREAYGREATVANDRDSSIRCDWKMAPISLNNC